MRGVEDRRHRCCGLSHDSGKCARERGRTAKTRFAERGRGGYVGMCGWARNAVAYLFGLHYHTLGTWGGECMEWTAGGTRAVGLLKIQVDVRLGGGGNVVLLTVLLHCLLQVCSRQVLLGGPHSPPTDTAAPLRCRRPLHGSMGPSSTAATPTK